METRCESSNGVAEDVEVAKLDLCYAPSNTWAVFRRWLDGRECYGGRLS